jgi:hypothetical protein
MRINRLFLVLPVVAFAVLMFILFGTPAVGESPDTLMIYNEGYNRKLYEPVLFTHLEHVEDFGIECTDCHHDYKDGENVWQEGDPVRKCAACHNPKKKQGTVHRLVFAFHFNCKKCHKDNEAGPIECKECHKKKGASP